jgi:spore maturation protein CgeB
MKILYIGSGAAHSTSKHRADALGRLGHAIKILDPYDLLNQGKFWPIFHFQTGYRFLAEKVCSFISEKTAHDSYDAVWVDSGELINRKCVKLLRDRFGPVINYNLDDPTGMRDGRRWATFIDSIPAYDLCVVVRKESEAEYPDYGAKRVLRVWRSADEVAHAPRMITPLIYEKWKSEVAFVGTWMPERGPFMMQLANAGIPLSIWGNRWNKAKEWKYLEQYWRGGGLVGDDYAYAIQCAKINLGLLSKGNRDFHTQRSAEIPSLGGLFCAERTEDHLNLYQESDEAFFWGGAVECAEVLRKLLTNDRVCHVVSDAGHRRFLQNELTNSVILGRVLGAL